MSKVRVQMFGQGRGITIDSAATWGAVVGENLRWPDGSVVTEQELRAAATSPEDGGAVYWRTIMEIPPNVTALAEQAGTGLYVLTGEGSSVTRALAVEPGELTLDNASGVDGNPTLGLPTITPGGGGTLQRYGFDDKGRRTHEEAADTDDLDEGEENLYFTEERSQDAVGALMDGSGDVQLHYEVLPDRRVWAELSESATDSLALAEGAVQRGDPVLDPLPPDAVDDAAAALLDVPVGGVYRNGSALMVRVS